MGVEGNSPKKSKTEDISQDLPLHNETSPKMDNIKHTDDKTKTLAKTNNPANKKGRSTFIIKPHNPKQKLSDAKKNEYLKEVAEMTEDVLQQFFLESFGGSSSQVFDAISQFGELHNYNASDNIVKKGDVGLGIFVVIKGKVCVTTSDSSVVIETLQTGDIFGELSSIYDIPSTANVNAMSDAEVAFVPKGEFRQLMDEFDSAMDIIDWCIFRRYLPTSDLMDTERAYRRTAFTFLRKSDFFRAWPDNALKSVILSFDHHLVLLYPANSMIIIDGDPLNSMFFILKGNFVISRGPRIIADIEINRRSRHFMFGGTGVSNEDQTATFSIKTASPCQVILVPKEYVLKVADEFPDLKQDLVEKKREHNFFIRGLGHLYKRYEPDLQPEVLSYRLHRSDYYCNKPEAEIRNKIRRGVYHDFDSGAKMFLDVERESFETFLVIRGGVELTNVDETEDIKHVLSEGSVGVLNDIQLSSVETISPCLILKIPRYVQRPVQELDKLELV